MRTHKLNILSLLLIIVTACSSDNEDMDITSNDDNTQQTAKKITSTIKTTNLPPRLGFKMAAFNGEYWLMGGNETKEPGARETKEYFNDIWKSSDGETWTRVVENAPWSKRSYFNLFEFDGKLWIIGGLDITTDDPSLPLTKLNDVWNSNDGINWTKVVEQGTWEGTRSLPFTTAQNGKMYLIGGHTSAAWTLYKDIWESTNGTVWNKIGTINKSILNAEDNRNGIWKQSVVKLNNEYFMLGGSLSTSWLPFTSVLKSTDMINWSVATRDTPWQNEHYLSINNLDPFVWNGKIYVVIDAKEYSNTGTTKQYLFSSTNGTTWNEELQMPSFSHSGMVPALGYMENPQYLKVGDKINVYGSFHSSIVVPQLDTEIHLVQLSKQ